MSLPTVVFVSFSLLLAACGREEKLAAPATSSKPPAAAKNPAAAAAPAPAPTDRHFHGLDKRRLCRLTLHREWYEGGIKTRENYRAEVSTSYADQGAEMGKVTLAFTADGVGKVLAWEDKDKKEFLRLDLANPSDKIESPDSFILKYYFVEHGHHHRNLCSELRPTP